MIAHIEAMKAKLAAHGVTAYYVDAPDSPEYPYVILWGPIWGADSEPITVDDGSFDTPLYVTVVAITPDMVSPLAALVRSVLKGPLQGVPGRSAHLFYQRPAQSIQMDRKVTVPDTNRNPAFAVERYELVSTPA